MVKAPDIMTFEDGLDRAMEGGYAYIMDAGIVSYMYSQNCEKLHMAQEIFNANGVGFAVPKNAHYRDAFSNM